ncbi:MAG: molybdopterin-dependent oxidoreductase [Candidatus Limnocylindria bacterium]
MSNTTLDRLLAALVLALVATGLISLRAGVPHTAPLFAAHALLSGALLGAVAVKLRRSVPRAMRGRRWARLALASLLTLLAFAALAGGIAWAASGTILTLGSATVLTLHIWAGLALLPIVVVHVLPRRWRVLRPRVHSPAAAQARQFSRRTFLAGALVAGVSLLTWGGSQMIERLTGSARRFTGSRWLPRGGAPPVTTFFGEGTPEIDPAGWRLRVHGRVARAGDYSLAELRELGERDRSAVLDCTSGWVLETDWRGVPLGDVLEAADADAAATDVTVRSTTGWYARLPISEARGALLALSVAGAPLPAGNGAPCRLVAPGRRGLEWVKWVAEIEVA